MNIIKPEKLRKGDMIGIISPSSPVTGKSRLDGGVAYFEKMGYRVQLGSNVMKTWGYLAGTDAQRVSDIHEMFLNKSVKLIICLRGGYGASRLLDKIDYNLIRENPKIFCGYSDITALQNAILHKTGLVTFAGPMPGVDFYKDISSFTEENFWQTVTDNRPVKVSNPSGVTLNCLKKGSATGRLFGGNLSLFASLIGTCYLPQPDNKILLLEEIGEVPYRIDRMLNQLRLAGILGKINGLIMGSFSDCEETDPERNSLTFNEVVEDYFIKNFNAPVFNNVSHGHLINNLTLPIGINIAMNGNNCSLEFLESHLS
jgi:muramoyltetrapeptide carboxypeptidase